MQRSIKEGICGICEDPLIIDKNWTKSSVAKGFLRCSECRNLISRVYRLKLKSAPLVSGMIEGKTCYSCDEPLVLDANWTRSQAVSSKHLCNCCSSDYFKDRRDANLEVYKLRERTWRSENKGLVNAYGKLRRTRKINRTPSWADLEAIKEIYKEAADLNDIHGPGAYHVDHIIPLQGKTVSGLHVENNLQILKAVDNLKKSNKYVQ